MKHKLSFLIATVALAANSAFAAGALEKSCGAAACPSDTDYAGQVKGLFDNGSAPGSLTPGDYTGRCYAAIPPQQSNSATGQGAFLAIESLEENANQGPLFPGSSEIGFAVVSAPNTELTHYDDGQNVDDPGNPVLAACVQNNDLVAMSSISESDPTDHPGAQAYVLRKNGSYLVVKAEVTQDVPAAQLKAGDAYGYCYFFKKVK